MKHLKQKLLLTALLLLAVVYANALEFTYYGIKYKTNSDGVTCYVSQQSSSGKNVSIREKVSYDGIEYTVTSIGANAFSSCSKLESISIPSSVTSIDKNAFLNCTALTSINIPYGVTTISESMFYGCSSLTTVFIPSSVTSIEKHAFRGCM